MRDLVIRGALLVDGLGSAPRVGYLAVKDGRIAALGRDLGPSRETLDTGAHLTLFNDAGFGPHLLGH